MRKGGIRVRLGLEILFIMRSLHGAKVELDDVNNRGGFLAFSDIDF